jgi:phage/plasmid-like protein (TIGR03299 family)
MAANIETYIGREAAWHNMGTVTGHFMTWAEILQHGGLDFQVFKSQLRDGLGRPVKAWGTFRWDHEDWHAGNKDNARFLGVVGEDYKVIQHATGFELVDAIVQSQSGAHYETAGVLGNGEVVWGLADLGTAISVGDDKQNGYLLFCTSHNGSYSYVVKMTLVRVVCQNTLNVALSTKTASQFRVKHTKNAMGRITDAHKTLAAIAGDMASVEQTLRFLAGRKVTKESLAKVMARLFPVRTKTDDNGDAIPVNQTRRENIISEILQVYEYNDGPNGFQEQRGTAYNLLNAVTDWVDHFRGTDGKRGENALFGSGDELKSTALTAILDAAEKDMPPIPQSIAVSNYADIGLQVPGLVS